MYVKALAHSKSEKMLYKIIWEHVRNSILSTHGAHSLSMTSYGLIAELKWKPLYGSAVVRTQHFRRRLVCWIFACLSLSLLHFYFPSLFLSLHLTLFLFLSFFLFSHIEKSESLDELLFLLVMPLESLWRNTDLIWFIIWFFKQFYLNTGDFFL